jgi:hypothetical protein
MTQRRHPLYVIGRRCNQRGLFDCRDGGTVLAPLLTRKRKRGHWAGYEAKSRLRPAMLGRQAPNLNHRCVKSEGALYSRNMLSRWISCLANANSGWIFAKAFGLVAEEFAVLRQAYFQFPFPYLRIRRKYCEYCQRIECRGNSERSPYADSQPRQAAPNCYAIQNR